MGCMDLYHSLTPKKRVLFWIIFAITLQREGNPSDFLP